MSSQDPQVEPGRQATTQALDRVERILQDFEDAIRELRHSIRDERLSSTLTGIDELVWSIDSSMARAGAVIDSWLPRPGAEPDSAAPAAAAVGDPPLPAAGDGAGPGRPEKGKKPKAATRGPAKQRTAFGHRTKQRLRNAGAPKEAAPGVEDENPITSRVRRARALKALHEQRRDPGDARRPRRGASIPRTDD